MSFIVLPNKIHTDSVMCNSIPILSGVFADEGLVVYYAAPLGMWVMINAGLQPYPWDCVINFDGSPFSPIPSILGNPAWLGAEGIMCYSFISGNYQIVPNDWAAAIANPPENVSWWSCPGSAHSGTWTGHGTATGTKTSDVTTWARWQCASPVGVYEPAGGATGNRVVGTPKFIDGAGKTYTKIIHTESVYFPPPFNYGDAKYVVGTGWVIGSINDATGWWVSTTEPSVLSPTTFTFTKPSGSEITGSNIVLTFLEYILGNQTKTLLLGEAAIWRP